MEDIEFVELEVWLDSEFELGEILLSNDEDEVKVEGVLGRFLHEILIFYLPSLIRAVRHGDVGEWRVADPFASTSFLGFFVRCLSVCLASFGSSS